MKILTNRKLEEIKSNNYINGVNDTKDKYEEEAARLATDNKVKKGEISQLKEINKNLNDSNIMLIENNKKLVEENGCLQTALEVDDKLLIEKDEEINKLKAKIEKLKENVREAHNKLSEKQVQAVAIAIEDEAKTKKKTVKKVVNEIVEESKEKKTIKATKVSKSKMDKVEETKKETTKKRGRKSNVAN